MPDGLFPAEEPESAGDHSATEELIVQPEDSTEAQPEHTDALDPDLQHYLENLWPSQLITKALYSYLPGEARKLIQSDRYTDHEDPYRNAFAKEPNNPLMHESNWHQWGIISHTIRTGIAFEREVPQLLEHWFGQELAASRFGLTEEKIGHLSKLDLLKMSVPLHDLGKFTERRYKGMKPDGRRPDFGFTGHEAASGQIVRARQDQFAQTFFLTKDQIEYLARCAELHYELGKVRARAQKSAAGYSLAFTNSPAFSEAARAIAASQPGFEREMGIFFLADSLGKIELRTALGARTDEELAGKLPLVQAELAQRDLEPALAKAALQLAVNVRAAERYLALIGQESGQIVRKDKKVQAAGEPERLEIEALLAGLPEALQGRVLYYAITSGQVRAPHQVEQMITELVGGYDPVHNFSKMKPAEIADFAYRWHSLDRALKVFTDQGLYVEAAAFAKAHGGEKASRHLAARAQTENYKQAVKTFELVYQGNRGGFEARVESLKQLIRYKQLGMVGRHLEKFAEARAAHDCVKNKHEHKNYSSADREKARACRELDAEALEAEAEARALLREDTKAQELWLEAASVLTEIHPQTYGRVIRAHEQAGSHLMARWLKRQRLETQALSPQEKVALCQTLASDYAKAGAAREALAMTRLGLKYRLEAGITRRRSPNRLPK